MVSRFNSLPQEILDDIINRVVCNESRRSLLSMALISKDFTKPAQQALWTSTQFSSGNFTDRLRQAVASGYGKDKIISSFLIQSNAEKEIDIQKLVTNVLNFLNGVKVVLKFGFMLFNDRGSFGMVLNLRQISSVLYLKEFIFEGVMPVLFVPSNDNLTTISIKDDRPYADSSSSSALVTFNSLLPTKTITSIRLINIKAPSSFSLSISRWFQAEARTITKLSLGICYGNFTSSIIPSFSQLKELFIFELSPEGDWSRQYLEAIPTTSRLVSLTLQYFNYSAAIVPDPALLTLTPLLQLEHFTLGKNIKKQQHMKVAVEALVEVCAERKINLSFESFSDF